MLTSVDCSRIYRLCVSERPCAAVEFCWSPNRSSRVVAFGSLSVLLEYNGPGPGMPRFIRNAWELERLLSFGRATCGSNVGGFCLVVCCMGYWMLGCVF